MLFISKEGDVINTDVANEYYKRVFELVVFWESDLQYIELKTSGSTGEPKIINITKTQIEASIAMTQSAFSLSTGDTFFCCLNVNYIAGMMMVFRALKIGGDLIVVEPSSNPFEKIKKLDYLLIDNRGRNFFAFVPLQIKNILESKKYIDLANTAKAIIIGGAAIDHQLEKKCTEINSPIFATYGMTETVSHIAIRNIKKKEKEFTIIKGVEIKKNEQDCLQIKATVTNNEWITTNDIIELVSKNKFELKGRFDAIINSGGIKINLAEIDLKISNKIKLNVRFFSYGLPDPTLGQKLVLIVESQEPIVNKENMTEIFTKFDAPKSIYYIKEFKETPTGKIDKIKTIDEIIRNKISDF